MNPFRILLLLAILAGCSKPTYVYRFQNHGEYNSALATSTAQTESIIVQKKFLHTHEDSVTRMNHQPNSMLLASASSQPVIYSSADNEPNLEVVTVKKIANSKINLVNKHTKLTDTEQEGDPKKNWGASLGLLFSFIGLTVIFGFYMAPLFAIFGAIFSSIGLKSEKKKRAKAGLVFSLIGIALAILFILFFVFSGGWGA